MHRATDWFRSRWAINSPLVNFASCVLLALGLANVGIGLVLIHATP